MNANTVHTAGVGAEQLAGEPEQGGAGQEIDRQEREAVEPALAEGGGESVQYPMMQRRMVVVGQRQKPLQHDGVGLVVAQADGEDQDGPSQRRDREAGP